MSPRFSIALWNDPHNQFRYHLSHTKLAQYHWPYSPGRTSHPHGLLAFCLGVCASWFSSPISPSPTLHPFDKCHFVLCYLWVWFCFCFFFNILYISEIMPYLSFSVWLDLASYPPGPSMWSQMARLPFWWLNNIPVCVCGGGVHTHRTEYTQSTHTVHTHMHYLYPLIHHWTLRLLPHLGFCK